MYVYIYTYINIYIYIYINIYIYLYICKFLCVFVCIHVNIYIYIHIHIHTYIYNIHICIYAARTLCLKAWCDNPIFVQNSLYSMITSVLEEGGKRVARNLQLICVFEWEIHVCVSTKEILFPQRKPDACVS